jgi:phosphinothricin acetyltransferase
MESVMREATEKDAEAICGIYNPYIQDTTITFEESPVSVAEMASRMGEVATASLPWLVEEANGSIIGYAHSCACRL